MMSQPMSKETVLVVTTNGMNFPQTEKSETINQRQDSLKKYVKAEVKVIGTIQIMCGMMVLSLGITLASALFSPHFTSVISPLVKSCYPFIGALCFIISGSLSVTTEKKSTKTLVHSNLVFSILSTLAALVGFIILSVNLAALSPALQRCELDKESLPTSSYYYHHDPYGKNDCFTASASLAGTLSVMLIGTVLELCLAVLITMLWWKQVHADIPRSVLFLPHGPSDIYTMPYNTPADSGYEELITS
ncbi:membrane-spanning 4-domains subfamily A member 6A [Tupaia chinensis]|uniref:membrane-spanning 4-domains subfamily A member 6A n=1 Tax=Tupaia chinensis TaxID=246437 RepID=UPI0003C91235|nr:membrane-spanning 4-domains subfamily A member 6A [Tupaia chinensis]